MFKSLCASFTIMVLGHAQSPSEGLHDVELDVKAGALLRRSDEDVSPMILDSEEAGHQHHRSNAKGHNRHAQIDAFGHMSAEDAHDDAFENAPSLDHVVNHALQVKIDASGYAKGLPEMSDDLVEDEENETHTAMVKHVRQLHSLKTGDMLSAIKRVSSMEEDFTKPWSDHELVHTIGVLQGHNVKPFTNASFIESPSTDLVAKGEQVDQDEVAMRMVLDNIDYDKINLSDPSSLAELAMIPKGGVAKAVVGFLFGASWVVDEDYPFLCICGGTAVCESCPLGTTCRMRRGAGNGAFGMAHAHWMLPLIVALSLLRPAYN